MTYADKLEKEIEEIKSKKGKKDFKTIKADKNIMMMYNELKEWEIINVKPSIGRNSVKLETILKNIKISTNLIGLRKAHEEEDKRRNMRKEKKKRM